MKSHFEISMLFPEPLNDYAGPRIAIVFLIVVNIAGTARSLVHMFAPDSGAQSIATMNVGVAGGPNIIAMLAQWGGGQLIMAIIIWIVIFRYRILTPLMIAEIFLEQIIRILIGQIKPMVIMGTPPGRIGSYILLPLSAIMLVVSMWRTAPA